MTSSFESDKLRSSKPCGCNDDCLLNNVVKMYISNRLDANRSFVGRLFEYQKILRSPSPSIGVCFFQISLKTTYAPCEDKTIWFFTDTLKKIVLFDDVVYNIFRSRSIYVDDFCVMIVCMNF